MAEKAIAHWKVKEFALEQAGRRLDKIVSEVKGLLQLAPGSESSADAIHDFRVATRRFRAVLDTFPDFFPKADRRKVKKMIRAAFSLAGEVRNRDITVALIKESAAEMSEQTMNLLEEDRAACERRLRNELRAWMRRDFSARWRERLELP